MKKLIIILLFCYLIPTLGISITLHYCSNQLMSFSLNSPDKDSCICGSEKIKMPCCKNKTLTFVNENHPPLTSDFSLNFKFFFKLKLICSTPLIDPFNYSLLSFIINTTKSPPADQFKNLIILHRVLRI
jgi:hypothetical protein